MLLILKNYQGALFIGRCCGKVCCVADLLEALKEVYGGQSILCTVSVSFVPLLSRSSRGDLLCQVQPLNGINGTVGWGRYSELAC